MQQVHVRKDSIGEAELVECEQGALAENAIRLEVESFSVTANNVTYAAVGDGFGYWNFSRRSTAKASYPCGGMPA
ncbi:DUF2855 family protein [Erythrobacter aureus]|uniref:DUF2855 family protein n=1 Tax=Erythrobacter aureus TaxID=2182384 RepID=UPI001F2AFC88|nr:DUF2855 family protein [Erythrobacter aureus]